MNIFKKIVEELKNRLQLNVDFKENGLCLNVALKPTDQTIDSTFYIGIMGEDTLIGGTLVTILECKYGNKHLSPKFKDDSDMFILLNGFLVPDGKKENVLLKDLIPLVDEDGTITMVRNQVNLANGYSLSYLFIPTHNEKDFYGDEGNYLEDQFFDYLYTNLEPIFPADRTATFIVNTKMEDSSNLYKEIMFRIRMEFSVEELGEYDEKSYSILGDCVSKYIYMNGLSKYRDHLSSILGKVVEDIPTSGKEQIIWFNRLKESTKKDKWGLALKEFTYRWKDL